MSSAKTAPCSLDKRLSNKRLVKGMQSPGPVSLKATKIIADSEDLSVSTEGPRIGVRRFSVVPLLIQVT